MDLDAIKTGIHCLTRSLHIAFDHAMDFRKLKRARRHIVFHRLTGEQREQISHVGFLERHAA